MATLLKDESALGTAGVKVFHDTHRAGGRVRFEKHIGLTRSATQANGGLSFSQMDSEEG